MPLILYCPGTLPAGRRVPGFVQNLDLAPTVLELAGVPDRDRMEGLSLLPAIFGLRDGNYAELYLSEATWEVKRVGPVGRCAALPPRSRQISIPRPWPHAVSIISVV